MLPLFEGTPQRPDTPARSPTPPLESAATPTLSCTPHPASKTSASPRGAERAWLRMRNTSALFNRHEEHRRNRPGFWPSDWTPACRICVQCCAMRYAPNTTYLPPLSIPRRGYPSRPPRDHWRFGFSAAIAQRLTSRLRGGELRRIVGGQRAPVSARGIRAAVEKEGCCSRILTRTSR